MTNSNDNTCSTNDSNCCQNSTPTPTNATPTTTSETVASSNEVVSEVVVDANTTCETPASPCCNEPTETPSVPSPCCTGSNYGVPTGSTTDASPVAEQVNTTCSNDDTCDTDPAQDPSTCDKGDDCCKNK